MLGNQGIVSICAACGNQSATPEHWVRRHDALLCPDCDAALAAQSDRVTLHLARAEHEWERLWQQVEESLGKSA